MDMRTIGQQWATEPNVPDIPDEWYCQTRDVFGARLAMLTGKLEKSGTEDAYLLAAVTGEIGNNSFDHNLGNWRDLPGVFFASDESYIVLGDRGQGILNTIRHVKPDVVKHTEALRVAFREVISGRYPEQRGNGLKFVFSIIQEKRWQLEFYSGNAKAEIRNGIFNISESDRIVPGCFAVIQYSHL